MASEEQDILAKINQLRGQINQHKNAETNESHPSNPSVHHPAHQPVRGSDQIAFSSSSSTYIPSYARYNRGGHHSYRGTTRGRGGAPIHRNRTLVLNGNSQTDSMPTSLETSRSTTPVSSGSSWVVKKDRHMQLINSAVYDDHAKLRAKALEETRQQKIKQRDEREKLKLSRHLQRLNGSTHKPGRSAPQAGQYEVNIQGIKFHVMKDGAKLVKVPGDINAAKSTPRTAIVGGVKFHRSRNGNLYRAGVVKAQRRAAGIKKVNEPCKPFSTTGSCPKGPACRYVHDASKVAICRDFLLKGSCPSGDSCDLSHELTPERTPACLHFAKGNCSNPDCRYSHVRVSPAALVCRPFAIYGYCEKGSSCAEKHVHECPDFSNTGTCSTKNCKLPHRYKASAMRKNNNPGDATSNEDSDISSDEDDEEVDSDDVDSDEFEEYFANDGEADSSIFEQKDFVQLA